jgi:hypothetical protein
MDGFSTFVDAFGHRFGDALKLPLAPQVGLEGG